MTRPFFILSVLAFVIACTLFASYFGACAYDGDNGGKGNPVALIMAAVFLFASILAFRSRKGPMQ